MADFGLQAALTERRQRNFAENPLYNTGAAIQQMDLSGYDLNPWEGFLAAALRGAAGGFVQGYGKGQIQDENAQDATAFGDAYNKAAGGGTSLVDALKSNPRTAEFAQYAAPEEAGRLKDIQDKIVETQATQMAKGPMLGGQQQIPSVNVTRDPSGALNVDYGAQVKPPAAAPETDAPNSMSAAYGESLKKHYAENLQLGFDDSSAFKTAQEQAQQEVQFPVTQEDKLRDELRAQKPSQDYQQSSGLFRAMVKASKGDDRPSDLVLISAFAKLRDPTSQVTNNEFKSTLSAQDIFGQYAGEIDSLIHGSSRLSEKARNDFLNAAQNQVKGFYDQYATIAEQQKGIAGRRGLNSENLGILGAPPELPKPAPIDPKVPPGMKLQRNKATGETRLVPQ